MLKKKPPIFFSEMNIFVGAIPQINSQISNNIFVNEKFSALLKNYLDFYNIDFINGNDTKKNIAITHKIWRSQILAYHIIEQCWQPKNFNGKTLFIIHGYFEHTGLYQNIIFWSLSNGYKVHLFDLPGHGLSSGKKADIDSFNTYGNILISIIGRENPKSYSLIGQSTGGAIAINALLSKTDAVHKITPENIILLAPLVRSHHWQEIRWFYYAASRFISSIKRSFSASSHSALFNNFLEYEDPLQARQIPLSWLGAMDNWIKQIETYKKNTSQPCWLIQGTGDKTVDYKYNITAIKRILPQIKVEMIADAANNLINEDDKYWQQVSTLLFKAQANLETQNS
jgi:alpha-beta hydrolase superfamily lysophospholipase